MILMAYVDGFKMKNINIENSHAWAVSFERTKNADISDIRINNSEEIIIDHGFSRLKMHRTFKNK